MARKKLKVPAPRVSKPPQPSDGSTMTVEFTQGGRAEIIDPRCTVHPEWILRYGHDPTAIRLAVASLLSSYDYLLSGAITQAEAIERLRLMRAMRKAAVVEQLEAEQEERFRQSPSVSTREEADVTGYLEPC